LNPNCKKTIGYRDADPWSMQYFLDSNASLSKLPFVRVSRPGVYGSSGVHGSRMLFREIQIMDAALDTIKKKHKIDKLSISGQSGGGHVVTSLITLRNDVVCAVSSSGAVAVRKRVFAKGWNRDITGYSNYFDPIDHIDQISAAEGFRFFLLGDPKDSNAPFSIQKAYLKKENDSGLDATLIEFHGSGSQNHGLEQAAITVSTLCALNTSTEEILERAKTGYILLC
ncbi:MAG: hypothetical protein V3S24_04335, partial [Candidatus Tectomicrobia bacterium]